MNKVWKLVPRPSPKIFYVMNKIWKLVPRPSNKTIIGTRWVFRNKLDENVDCLKQK